MYTLRNIADDDLAGRERILRFIAANTEPTIRARPDDQLSEALASGLAFELMTGTETCGCSLIYGYDTGAKLYSEIGTELIHTDHRGLGLQQLFAQFHIVQAAHEDYSFGKTIFAVVSHKSASEHVLTNRVGMMPWEPPPDLIEARAIAGVPFDPEKLNLVVSNAIVRHSARGLLALSAGDRTFKTPKQGLEVDIQVGWPVADVIKALS